jgi:hypothetical protein
MNWCSTTVLPSKSVTSGLNPSGRWIVQLWIAQTLPLVSKIGPPL